MREYEEADIARSRIGDEGMARMQSDAEGIFSAIGRNLTTEERKGLSDAAAKEESLIFTYKNSDYQQHKLVLLLKEQEEPPIN